MLLAGICLTIGVVGIANTTLVTVMERTVEIGLRRALGARSHHIASQFRTESATLAALGGLVGTSLGTVTVVATAAAEQWTPVIDPTTVAAAPLIGLSSASPPA
ncbi:ABC transporter permease [Embleya sp. AB8]|uniref:ABC transporter permease n=1 Tax=Embleya sp. AB8 TaxID=3156304 RepID=UPI003C722681